MELRSFSNQENQSVGSETSRENEKMNFSNIFYNLLNKKAPCLQAGNELGKCFKGRSNHNSVHTGNVEFKPDKPGKNCERWNKASGSPERGTVDEAGTPDALPRGGCQGK